jgi:glucose-1-phosphate thymidylyltransferase
VHKRKISNEDMPDTRNSKKNSAKILGLIPAAGRATRLGPLPCSKEIYPIGFRSGADGQGPRPKAVGHYLLEKMQHAGIEQAYIVLRAGKWDIPACFQDGAAVGMRLGYLVMDNTDGVPYTLDHAYPFVQDALVALGFPDILFSADDAFVHLLQHQARTGSDVVLGLFLGDQPHKTDMVEVDERGAVRRILIKPGKTDLRYTWGIAVWSPAFTQFMHEFLASRPAVSDAPELHAGDVIQAAIQAGLHVQGVHVSAEPYLDIGTPEDLALALARYTPQRI